MSIGLKNGKQSVEVCLDSKAFTSDNGTWYFCTNGNFSTGVKITVEQFDMLTALVAAPKIVEYYESIRIKRDKV
jgi:hypothetical protein|tara:strand:+ start:1515 stop:1736 length:222 start_codon:yes stop_codon:yes gene_type:complete